jgi:hypothetical protein
MADQLIQFSLLSGLDTRTDQHSQQIGNLDQAQNVVFDKTGAVRKRHGNVAQGNKVIPGSASAAAGVTGSPIGGATLPANPYGYLTRYGEQNIVAGTRLYTYEPGIGSHSSKDDYPEAIGTRRPLVAPQGQVPAAPQSLISILNPDVAVSTDGFICYAYQTGTLGGSVTPQIGFAIYAPASGGGHGPYVYGNPTIGFPSFPSVSVYNPKVIAIGTAFVILFAANQSNSEVCAMTIVHSAAGWISGPITVISTYATLTLPVAFDVGVSGSNFLLCSATASTVNLQLITPDLATNGTYTVVSSTNLSSGGAGSVVDNMCLAVNGANVWVFWHVASTALWGAIVAISGFGSVLAPTNLSAITGLLGYMGAVASSSSGTTYLVLQGTGIVAGAPIPYLVTSVGGFSAAPVGSSLVGKLTGVSRPVLIGSKVYMMCWLNSTLQGTWLWVDLNAEAVAGGNITPYYGPRVVCCIAPRLATGYVVAADTLTSVIAISPGVYITPIGVVLGGASRGASGTIQLWEGRVDYTHPNRALASTMGRATVSASSVYDGQLITESGFFSYPESYTATGGTATTSGGNASITTKSGSTMTITGITGAVVAQIGSQITISGAASSGNNGTFPITAIVSSTSLKYTNASGVASDANNPNIGWIVGLVPGQVYLYALIWEWTTAGGELVLSTTQASATSQTLAFTAGSGGAATINLNAFLVTSKFDSENSYATPPTLGLYRSQAGGTTLTKVANIGPTAYTGSAWPSTYLDFATDAQIAGNYPLYFVPGAPGGVLDNVCPPSSSHTITALGTVWFILDDLRTVGWMKPYVEGFQPAWNELLSTTVEDGGDLVALAALNQNVILFSTTRIYLTYGQNPGATGTNAPPYAFQPIQTDVGCIDPRSVLAFPDGVLFLSSKGLCVLGQDMTVNYLDAPEDVLAAYPNLTSAVLVPEHHEVRIELNNGGQTGVCLVLNYWSPAAPYRYKWSTFTRYDTGGGVTQPMATAAGYVGGYRWAAASGYPYTEDTSGATYLDDGLWVVMKVQTGWISVNGIVGYQRGTKWAITGDWYTSHDLVMTTQADFNTSTTGPTGQTATIVSSQFEGGPLTRAKVGIQYQKHEAVRFMVQDASPTGADGTVGSGRGFSLSGFGLLARPKPGFKLIKVTQSA